MNGLLFTCYGCNRDVEGIAWMDTSEVAYLGVEGAAQYCSEDCRNESRAALDQGTAGWNGALGTYELAVSRGEI